MDITRPGSAGQGPLVRSRPPSRRRGLGLYPFQSGQTGKIQDGRRDVLRTGPSAMVNVVEPALRPDEQGRLPHIWEDASLCLNTAGQWSPKMLLVDTVLPWSSEWLLHYEVWKGTGIWFGDGASEESPEAQSKLLHPLVIDKARAAPGRERPH